MKKLITMICCVLALTVCLTACGQSAAPANEGLSLAKGGTLVLSVNPEIAVEYDKNGNVTGVTARNNDALAIINSCTDLIGQPTREVVTDLVTAIGDAGYFVEEIEGQRRQITLEIEPGSSLPNDAFLDDVIADIRDAVNEHDWSTPLVVEGESDFGLSDYIDTDYGIDNDGITDYIDTDYGPDNDGVTDYDDTDYGPNNDGVTDYSNYGNTDYNDSNTNYGDSAYGDSGYKAPAATNPPAASGNTDYDDGHSDYNGSNTDYGNTDYNDSQSDYSDNNTNYGDSGYKAPAATNPPANYGGSDSGYSDYDADSGYSDYEGES